MIKRVDATAKFNEALDEVVHMDATAVLSCIAIKAVYVTYIHNVYLCA